MVSKSQIALVNKALNQKYENKAGYVKPKEGDLNSSFEALHSAIYAEYGKKYKLPYDLSSSLKNCMRLAKVIEEESDFNSASPAILLLKCAYTLHGVDVELNDIYWVDVWQAGEDFSRLLGVTDSDPDGDYATNSSYVASVLRNAHYGLASCGSKIIASMQQKLNRLAFANYQQILSNRYFFSTCNGLISQNDFHLLIACVQSEYNDSTDSKLEITGKLDQATLKIMPKWTALDNYAKDNLEKLALGLQGYLNINYSDITDDQLSQARIAFMMNHKIAENDLINYWTKLLTYKAQLNSEDIKLAYTTWDEATKLHDDHTGIQCFDKHATTIDMLEYFTDPGAKHESNHLYQGKLSEHNIIYNSNENRKIPDQLSYYDDVESKQKTVNIAECHTQTLINLNDNYLLTGANDQRAIEIIRKNKKHKQVIKWAEDFVILSWNEKQNKYQPVCYLYDSKNLIHHETLKRNEIVVSPNRKWLLVTPINTNNNQYFFLYDFANILNSIDLLSKVSSNTPSLDITGFKPIDSFEIKNFVNSANNTSLLDSVQGYAIGNDKTIYISSQLGPQKSFDKANHGSVVSLAFDNSVSKIAVLPWHKPQQIQIYPLILKHEQLQTWLKSQYKGLYETKIGVPECEGIQLDKGNDILSLSVTWHVYLSRLAIAIDPHSPIDPNVNKSHSVVDPNVNKSHSVVDPNVNKSHSVIDPNINKSYSVVDPNANKSHSVVDPDANKSKIEHIIDCDTIYEIKLN